MSDLAAPLLYVMRDEAEAFWAFSALMDRCEQNFNTDCTCACSLRYTAGSRAAVWWQQLLLRWTFVQRMEHPSRVSTSQVHRRMRAHRGVCCGCRGMHRQLGVLGAMVAALDPELHAFLAARDATNYFFTYRWMLIYMKREFAFDEVRRLGMTAGEPCKYVGCSVTRCSATVVTCNSTCATILSGSRCGRRCDRRTSHLPSCMMTTSN